MCGLRDVDAGAKGPSTGTLIVRHDGPTEISTIELNGSYDPAEAEAATIFPQAIPEGAIGIIKGHYRFWHGDFPEFFNLRLARQCW